MNIQFDKKTALIIVDPQNDFCEGGKLAVVGGNAIMGPIDDLSLDARIEGSLIVITQDWHPNSHNAFAENNGFEPFTQFDTEGRVETAWPKHCVQGTDGAMIHNGLASTEARAELILRKGCDPKVHSYSAFMDDDQVTKTGLEGYLKERGIEECVFVGIAYDYCVGFSAIDAANAGFKSTVIKSMSPSIGSNIEGIEKAFEEAGVLVI